MSKIFNKITFLGLCLATFAGASHGAEPADSAKTTDKKADKVSVCSVNCVDPTETSEGAAVIDVIKTITKGFAEHNYAAMMSNMDPSCTTYNEDTKKLVVGRENIIADVKEKVAAEEARLNSPPISFTIDHPYAIVTGNQAVVTFVLVKEIGGAHPARFEEHCSDVFVKRDGGWKKLHFCGDAWAQVK